MSSSEKSETVAALEALIAALRSQVKLIVSEVGSGAEGVDNIPQIDGWVAAVQAELLGSLGSR